MVNRSPEAHDRVMDSADENPDERKRRGGSRGLLFVGAFVAAALLVAVVVILITRGDGGGNSAVTTVTTTTPSTTRTSSSTTAPLTASLAIWPTTSSTVHYADPVDAARAFVTGYVGFVNPVVGAFQQGDSRSGEVPVQARTAGPVTTVLVRQLGSDGSWSVIGSSTPNIQVTAPAVLATVTSPVTLAGNSTAFEATVNVEVREDSNATPLGKGFVMGGANGQMGPFTATLAFTKPAAAAGALIFMTLSPETSTVSEATVLRVKFR